MVEDRIIERIRRLIALSTSSNEHEAAAAAAKAQELLFKYNLDMAAIEERTKTKGIGLTPYRLEKQARWKNDLLVTIADVNFCKLVRFPSYSGASYAFVGKEENIEVAVYFFEHLSREVERFAKERASGRGLSYITSYKRGMVWTIAKRLRAQFQTNKTASPESTALVVLTDTALEQALKNFFPKIRVGGTQPEPNDIRGLRDGLLDGAKVSINQGVKSAVGNTPAALGAGQ